MVGFGPIAECLLSDGEMWQPDVAKEHDFGNVCPITEARREKITVNIFLANSIIRGILRLTP